MRNIFVALLLSVIIGITVEATSSTSTPPFFPIASIGVSQFTTTTLFDRFFRETFEDQVQQNLLSTARTWSAAFQYAPSRPCSSAGPYEAWGWEASTTPPLVAVSAVSVSLVGAELLDADVMRISSIAHVEASTVLFANFVSAFCIEFDCDCSAGPSNWTLCDSVPATVSFDLALTLNVSLNATTSSATSIGSDSLGLSFNASSVIHNFTMLFTCAATGDPASQSNFPSRDPIFQTFNTSFIDNVSVGMVLLSTEAASGSENFLIEFGTTQLRDSWAKWVTGEHATKTGLHYLYRFDAVQTSPATSIIFNVSIAAESCRSKNNTDCEWYNPSLFPLTLDPQTYAMPFLPLGVASEIAASSSLLQVVAFHAFQTGAFTRNETAQVIDANLSEAVYMSLPVVEFALSKHGALQTHLFVYRGNFDVTCKNGSLKLLVAQFEHVTMIVNITQRAKTQSFDGNDGIVVAGVSFAILNFDNFRGTTFSITYPRSGLPEQTLESAIEQAINRTKQADNDALQHLGFELPSVTGLLWNPSLPAVQSPFLHVHQLPGALNSTAKLRFTTLQPDVIPPQPPPPPLPSMNVLTTILQQPQTLSTACGEVTANTRLTQVASLWTTSCRFVAAVDGVALFGKVGEWDSLAVRNEYGRWPTSLVFPCSTSDCSVCGGGGDVVAGDCHKFTANASSSFDFTLDVVPSNFDLFHNTSDGFCIRPSSSVADSVKGSDVFVIGASSQCQPFNNAEPSSSALKFVQISSLSCVGIPRTSTHIAISAVPAVVFGPCASCPPTLSAAPAYCSTDSGTWIPSLPSIQCVKLPQMSLPVAIARFVSHGQPCPILHPPWELSPQHSFVAVIVVVTVVCSLLLGLGVFCAYRYCRQKKAEADKWESTILNRNRYSLGESSEQQEQNAVKSLPDHSKDPPEIVPLPAAAIRALGLALICAVIEIGLWAGHPPMNIDDIVGRLHVPDVVHPDPIKEFVALWRAIFIACMTFAAVALACALATTKSFFSRAFPLSAERGLIVVRLAVVSSLALVCAAFVFPPMFIQSLHSVEVGELAPQGTFFGGAGAHDDFREAASVAIIMAQLPEVMMMVSNVISAFPIGISLGLILARLYIIVDDDDGHSREINNMEEGKTLSTLNVDEAPCRLVLTHADCGQVNLVFLLASFLLFCVDIVVVSLIFQTTKEPAWLVFSLLRCLSELLVLLQRPMYHRLCVVPSSINHRALLFGPAIAATVSTLVLNVTTEFSSSPASGIFLNYFFVSLCVATLFAIGSISRRGPNKLNRKQRDEDDAPALPFTIPDGSFRFAFALIATVLWCLVFQLRWVDANHNTLRADLIDQLRKEGIKFPNNVTDISMPIDPGLAAYVDALKIALWPLGAAILFALVCCYESFADMASFLLSKRKNKEEETPFLATEAKGFRFKPTPLSRVTNILAYMCIVFSCAILCYRDYVEASHLNHLIPDCAPQFYSDGQFLLRTAAGLFFDSVMLGRLVPLIAALVPASMRVLSVMMRNRSFSADFYSCLALSSIGSVCLMLPLIFCVAIGESALPVSMLAIGVIVAPMFLIVALRLGGVVRRMRLWAKTLAAHKSAWRRGLSILPNLLSSSSAWWMLVYLPMFLALASTMFVYDPALKSAVTKLLADKSIQYEIVANFLSAGVAFLDVATLILLKTDEAELGTKEIPSISQQERVQPIKPSLNT